MSYLKRLESVATQQLLTEKLSEILRRFYYSYTKAVSSKEDTSPLEIEGLFNSFLDLVLSEIKEPFAFNNFHERILEPFNFYQFGLDFVRPLIHFESSLLLKYKNLEAITAQLEKKENVILLANHQTEIDPQILALLLGKDFPRLSQEIIFVAGHRVTTDPLAIPFSKGCNLLCIYSKKHIDHPIELKEKKLLHNQKTMKMMGQLLSEGGKCIYVAPSGGRDRQNEDSLVEVAPFDANSIEMFYLMAQQADKPTHFYPLALATYDLLPPPTSVEKELGEKRYTTCASVHAYFSEEINMEEFPGSDLINKKERRQARANHIWNIVNREYLLLKALPQTISSRWNKEE